LSNERIANPTTSASLRAGTMTATRAESALRSAKPVAGVETRQKQPLATTKPIHMRHDTTPIEAAIICLEVLTRLPAIVVVLEQHWNEP